MPAVSIEFLRPGAKVWVRKDFESTEQCDRFTRRLRPGTRLRYV